jgi:hypothetical protein
VPAVAALIAGGAYFLRVQLRPPHPADFLASAGRINAVADYLFRTSRAAGLTRPRVGIDSIVDYLDGRILRVVCYERHGVDLDFAVNLPDSILASSDELVFYKLRECDFVILTDRQSGHGHWPYDQQMIRLYPQLKAWCDEHRLLADTFFAFHREMSLYQRPELP